MKKIYLLLLALAITSGLYKSDAQVIASDSLALVDIYNAGDGPNWVGATNWLTGNVSTWAGVVVVGDRVTELSTEGRNMGGTLSPSVGNLTALTSLKIMGLENPLTIAPVSGTLPAEIWNLTNLKKLQIKFTNITGGIPAGISSMTALQEINFQQTYLGGTIPAELFNLPALTKAYLHESYFTGSLPSSLSNATNLTRLYLFGNKLEGPLPFVNIKNASANIKFTGNFFSFADVKQYHDSAANYSLSDDYQYAKEIVTDTVDLGTAEYFLDGTVTGAESYVWFKDDGATPISTLALDTIRDFSMSDEGTYVCKAQSSLVSNFDIRSVYELSLNDFVRDSLALVDIYNAGDGANWTGAANWLTGDVSTWAGVVVSGGRVTELSTEGRNMGGILSPSVGKLTALTSLKIMGLENPLTIAPVSGTLPAEIWNLTNLTKLQIKFTSITGGIPAGIESMTALQEINFQQTRLGGTIPAELFDLPALTKAYLHESDFTGSLPSTLSNATKLTRLYLFGNKLESPLPFVNIKNTSANIKFTGNFFTFDDVKQYHDSAANYNLSDDYQLAQENQNFTLNEGDSVAFELYVKDGEAYAWFYNENATPLSTDTLYYLSPVALTDTGVYVCKVQNSQISNFDIRAIFTVDTVKAVVVPASPEIVSAASSTDGNSISLTFDLEIADPSAEAANFTFTQAGTEIAVSSVSLNGSDAKIVVLTLATAINSSTAELKVSYTPGNLQSTEGGKVEAFGPFTVTNNVPSSVVNPNISNISIYPNPFTDYINITSSTDLKSVKVLDITGKSVWSQSDLSGTNLSLPVSELQKGIYFISIESTESTLVQKITKK